jgi:hypothetical protein
MTHSSPDLAQKRNGFVYERNIGHARGCAPFDLHLRDARRGPRLGFGAAFAPNFMGEWNDLEGS